MKEQIVEGNYDRFGASRLADGICFTFECEKESACAVRLYERHARKGAPAYRDICVPQAYCVGAVRSICIRGLQPERYDYNYVIDGTEVVDPFAGRIVGRERWADPKRMDTDQPIRSGFDFADFDWEEDAHPEIGRSEMVMYKLHVRGFTKDAGSRIRHKGTFAGICENISYLKELGITTIELMPAYEFEEMASSDHHADEMDFSNWSPQAVAGYQMLKKETEKKETAPARINYWGYGPGNYFAPKAGYSAGADAPTEFRQMVHALHGAGMECIMEIHFSEQENPNFAVEVLRHWVLSYHVDGFHLIAPQRIVASVSCDILLRRTKLFADSFPGEAWESSDSYPHRFIYNDDFLYAARMLINHANGNLVEFFNQQKKQHPQIGFVNYIAGNNGFTLADVFSYERKHNEENGEDGTDGNDYNYSSNCGVEGPTRKRSIQQQRNKRMLLAMASVLFSQSVPLILSGDEFGNSQNGNNNAYCQDNKTGWVNWRMLEKNRAYFEQVKRLLAIRHTHPALRSDRPMRMSDYETAGLPDLSYHGAQAWCRELYPSMCSLGVLYCGAYGDEASDLYLGWNFADTKALLALPEPPAGMHWSVSFGDGEILDELLEVPGASVTLLLTQPDDLQLS